MAAQQGADPGYRVGVVSESGDVVTWLRPRPPASPWIASCRSATCPPTSTARTTSPWRPDGKSYYVTIAHGTPFGSLWKLDASDGSSGRAQVELFPTTIALTPDGQYAFVANSDFHGDHPRVNVVTVVHTPTMNKITDMPACDMPHGVKSNHAGTRIYVSCMHSDEILELDVGTFKVLRRVSTGSGHSTDGHGGACAPTFVSVSPDDRRLYVACNTATRSRSGTPGP